MQGSSPERPQSHGQGKPPQGLTSKEARLWGGEAARPPGATGSVPLVPALLRGKCSPARRCLLHPQGTVPQPDCSRDYQGDSKGAQPPRQTSPALASCLTPDPFPGPPPQGCPDGLLSGQFRENSAGASAFAWPLPSPLPFLRRRPGCLDAADPADTSFAGLGDPGPVFLRLHGAQCSPSSVPLPPTTASHSGHSSRGHLLAPTDSCHHETGGGFWAGAQGAAEAGSEG